MRAIFTDKLDVAVKAKPKRFAQDWLKRRIAVNRFWLRK